MITNGFDITTVLSALQTRIGWQQSTAIDAMTLPDAMIQTDSGRYFQQFHPLITLENLRAVAENENMTDEQFIAFLGDLRDGVIHSVLNAVFNRPQQLESTLIFDRLRRNDIPLQKNGMFCGYRLWIAPGNYAAQISQVSFLFSGDATFNLYLFQDAIKAPIYTQSVIVNGGSETIIDLDEWIIKYIDKARKIQGGVFFLGYFQNDLPVNTVALDEFVDQWNPTLIFGYSAFEALQTVSGLNPDFNRISVPYAYKTYGMNLEIQTFRDFTNLVIKNASLFDELIGLSFSIVCLGYMTYTTRTNFIQRVTKEMAQLIYGEVNGNGSGMTSPYIAGLKKQIEREIKRVQDSVFYDPSKKNEFTTNRPQEWGPSDNPMLRV